MPPSDAAVSVQSFAVRPSPAISTPRGDALLGRYRMAALLAGAQLLLFVAFAPGYAVFNLHIAWSTTLPQIGGQAILLALWLYFRRYDDHPKKGIIPEIILVTSLLILLTNIASPAQYVAVALRRPLIDPWLARADALLGVNVATLAAWTASHSVFAGILSLCYFSFLPQFLLPIFIIGLWHRNRERLWEFAFHFHVCLIVTLVSFALFPAECAFQHYGFRSTIDWTRFITQFNGVRAGTFHVIKFNDLEGLISMPSFHVAGGLVVTWAFRGYRRLFLPLTVLNFGLIAATFFSGAHYFIDVIASVLLVAASVLVYRRWVIRLVTV